MYKWSNEEKTAVDNLEKGITNIFPHSWRWPEYEKWVQYGGITKPFKEPDTIIKEMRQKINTEAMIRVSGGVSIGGLWFPSDPESRIEYLILREAARDQLAVGGALGDNLTVNDEVVMLPLLDGTETAITCRKAIDLINDLQKLDQRLRKRKKAHIEAMKISPEPANYDYSINWPARYEEV